MPKKVTEPKATGDVVEKKSKVGRPRKNLPVFSENFTKDMNLASLTVADIRKMQISPDEIRYLVDSYYQMQKTRIAFSNQRGAYSRNNGEESLCFYYSVKMFEECERALAEFLKTYSDQHPIGVWLKSITGISGVLASGLLAYINIDIADTAGHLWSYAGWDVGGKTRQRGKKITWNPAFRTLCWKVGYSFYMSKRLDSSFYGKLYISQREKLMKKNEAGLFAERAKWQLENKSFKDKKVIETLKNGQITAAHIHAMALRWTVKIFLSHLHEVWYSWSRGQLAPAPYVFTKNFNGENLNGQPYQDPTLLDGMPINTTNVAPGATLDVSAYSNGMTRATNHAHYIAPPNYHLIGPEIRYRIENMSDELQLAWKERVAKYNQEKLAKKSVDDKVGMKISELDAEFEQEFATVSADDATDAQLGALLYPHIENNPGDEFVTE